jgi:hypothetical protein
MYEIYGYRVDPEAGLVYGLKGKPIGSPDTDGYLQVDARSRADIPGSMLSVHQLIWVAVNGPIPDGFEVNHKNGDKADNRLPNLELLTHQDNVRHAYRTGLKTNRGEKHPSRRLTEHDVREIRRLRSAGATLAALASQFGVTLQNIHYVARRKTWTHVGD